MRFMGTVDTGTGNGEAVYRSVAAAPKRVVWQSDIICTQAGHKKITSFFFKSQMPETQEVLISWSERIDMGFEVESV